MKPLRTAPSKYGRIVSEVLLFGAEVNDGGKWALYCHHDENHGEISLLQDTNRNRLWA